MAYCWHLLFYLFERSDPGPRLLTTFFLEIDVISFNYSIKSNLDFIIKKLILANKEMHTFQ